MALKYNNILPEYTVKNVLNAVVIKEY